jgi:hypothetical protein
MIHLQYYNSVIKNNHISKILNNYRIKYSQIKNEIELKINQMMKLYLRDILSFLENVEEVAEQKHKINEYNNLFKELEQTKAKMKDKISLEHKLKNECEILQQENCLLKLRIDSLKYKLNTFYNLNNNNNTSQNSSPDRKKSKNSLSKRSVKTKLNRNFLSPKQENGRNIFTQIIELNNSYNKSSMSLLSNDKNENKNIKGKDNIDKLSLKLNYDRMLKTKNNFKNKKKKKVNIKKYVHNYNNINNKYSFKNRNDTLEKNNNMKKLNNKKEDDYISKSRPIISKVTNKPKKLNSSVEINDNNNQNRYSPVNTINQSIELPKLTNRDCDNLGNNINDVIDNELKELEEDETKIEFLLEQLNKYRKGNKN